MRMRKNLRLALASIAAAGSVAGLCALGTGPALAAPRPAASAPVSKVVHPGPDHLAFRIEKVKTSSMPARARAAMKAAGLKIPAATNYIAELVNLQYGKCVDANDAGSTAGKQRGQGPALGLLQQQLHPCEPVVVAVLHHQRMDGADQLAVRAVPGRQ